MPSEKIELPPMPALPLLHPVPDWNADAIRAYARAYALLAVKQEREQERERCAKLCETLDHGAFGPPSYLSGIRVGSIRCANAIRKGSQ